MGASKCDQVRWSKTWLIFTCPRSCGREIRGGRPKIPRSVETVLFIRDVLSNTRARLILTSDHTLTGKEIPMNTDDRIDAMLDHALEMTFPASDPFTIYFPEVEREGDSTDTNGFRARAA